MRILHWMVTGSFVLWRNAFRGVRVVPSETGAPCPQRLAAMGSRRHVISAATVFSLAASACSHTANRQALVPYACSQPPPSSGRAVTFTASVIDSEANSLHLDFDAAGADFSALVVRFSDPGAWGGVMARIYHQGETSLGRAELDVGSTVKFVAIPPPCLDQPWLFLSDLQPSNESASDRP